jgi:hypothetical protein
MQGAIQMTDYKDRSAFIRAVGVLLLAAGMAAAALGPAEVYCFYLFSAGGPFHYEGFGFGSFMFGTITCQIAGYYLIAALFIPLGYGHLKLRRWARTLSLAGLWAWLIFGVPAVAVFLAMLAISKKPSPATMLVGGSLLVVLYPAIPAIFITLYRGRNVRLTFDRNDPGTYWTDKLPLAVLVLSFVLALYVIAFHVPLLFNGLFPLPGVLVSGLPGFVLVDLSILWLACLIWGVARLRAWAWWGALVYFGFITLSSIAALLSFSLPDVLARTSFAPKEMEALQGIPLQLSHLTPLAAAPLAATLGLLVYSRRRFRTKRG